MLALPALSTVVSPAEPTLPDLVDFVTVSRQPASEDIMNDEIPTALVMGDTVVFLWETDYTHWPNPDGSSPIEYPENEDVQVRFWTDGEFSDIINVSTVDTIPEGYGHHPRMTAYDGKLYVFWNSHAWTPNGAFGVVLRVYDPATGTWDGPREISETPEGGIAAGGVGTVHDGKLWVAWQGRSPTTGNVSVDDPDIEVLVRWFDGERWGPVTNVSGGTPGKDTEPAIISIGEELHVAWNHDDPVKPGNADIHHRVMGADGTWGEMTDGLGLGPSRNDKKVSLVDWNGTPVLLWQSDGINLRGQVYSDVALSVMGEDRWGPALVINPSGQDAGNVVPNAAVLDDRLYIAWATSDDGITLGKDLDVVMRDFDGQRFGDIVVLSPSDSHVDENPSDDGSVDLFVLGGNLYAVFDAIFSPVTDGPNKDIVLRYVGYDLDGDGTVDVSDAFPQDPDEWADSDGDGVGDNRDAYPHDRTRWEAEGDDPNGGRVPGDWCVVVGLVVAIAVPFLLLLGLHLGQGRKAGKAGKARGKG
jgi:hypothetical protein